MATSTSNMVWQHVVRPSNLLSTGSGTATGIAPTVPSEVPNPPCPVDDIVVCSTVNSETRAMYLGPQTDLRAEAILHRYRLNIARRIDVAPTPEETEAAAQDFVAVVVLTAVPDQRDLRPDAWNTPWDAAVLTEDANRSYTVLLYCRKVTRFTGVYPGAVLGIRGTILRRNAASMRAAEVDVERLVFPEMPQPLSSAVPPRLLHNGVGPSFRAIFAAGPYPRSAEGLVSAVKAVTEVAVQRRAQLCVICGPFLQEPRDGEPLVHAIEHLPTLLDVEKMCQAVAAAGVAAPATRFVVLPSLDDVACVPVLPQVSPQSFVDADSPNVVLDASNPVEVVVAESVRISVCATDIDGWLARGHVQRGLPPDGSARNPRDALLRTGVYAPPIDIAGRRISDVTMADRLRFGWAAANDPVSPKYDPSNDACVAPHIVMTPSVEHPAAQAMRCGPSDNATLWLSVGNTSTAAVAAVELLVTDIAEALRLGFVSSAGVAVGSIELTPTDLTTAT